MKKEDVYKLLMYILQLKRKVKLEVNYSGAGIEFIVKELQKEIVRPEDIK